MLRIAGLLAPYAPGRHAAAGTAVSADNSQRSGVDKQRFAKPGSPARSAAAFPRSEGGDWPISACPLPAAPPYRAGPTPLAPPQPRAVRLSLQRHKVLPAAPPARRPAPSPAPPPPPGPPGRGG